MGNKAKLYVLIIEYIGEYRPLPHKYSGNVFSTRLLAEKAKYELLQSEEWLDDCWEFSIEELTLLNKLEN